MESTIYPTDFYAANGIPHCELCGDVYHSDDFGVFCPSDNNNCRHFRKPAVTAKTTAKATATPKTQVTETLENGK